MTTPQTNANLRTAGFQPGAFPRQPSTDNRLVRRSLGEGGSPITLLALLAAGMLLAGTAEALVNTSQSGGYWTNAATWSDGVPTSDDDVFIAAGHTITNTGTSQISINSLSITGTLTHASNADTEAHIINLLIGAGGLTIDAAGQINVTSRGYSTGGVGNNRYGGSHGGEGGFGNNTTYVRTPYGSITNPVTCGSKGRNGAGGGVVILDISAGSATIDGNIVAEGQDLNILGAPPSGTYDGTGAGGSINITADSISGGGTLSAAGGDATKNGGGGGGGRIAIVTAGADFGNLTIRARPGRGHDDNYIVDDFTPIFFGTGAAGTIYLKKSGDVNGALLVDSQGRVTAGAPKTLLANAANQFDTITITNQAIFVVSSNATLNLTGCTLRSDSTTNSITSRLIIGTPTSTIIWPAAWTNHGTISWIGTAGVTTNMDLTVASGGILTHEAGSTNNNINLNLTGNLTIDPGGAIWASGRGGGVDYGGESGSDPRPGGSHGGQGGGFNITTYKHTFGSVTNPVSNGGSGRAGSPGGVAIIRTSGDVTVNGVLASEGTRVKDMGTGAGGSVNIRAGRLLGSGAITVRGGVVFDQDGGSGGGGRIAVVLTNAATFGSVTLNASGGANEKNASRAGAAGTIYLQGTNSPYGLLRIPGYTDSGAATKTLINTYVTDAVGGDVELQSNARFAISNACTLQVYGNWSNAVGPAALTGGGTVDLAGSAAASVWGDNTWSNLTINTAGKIVSFEHSKTQTVHGIPAFSNVTLRSTLDNTQWHLRKSGNGYQDVGVVTVYDSDAGTAGNHLTFRGAVGSDVSDALNVNWDAYKAKGTILLLR